MSIVARTGKEYEVLTRMQDVLERHGYEAGPIRCSWQRTYDKGDFQVVVSRLDGQMHDPIEAEVSGPGVLETAYNAKGLAVILRQVSNQESKP